ncbi:FAD/NAD(P)-binding protein [Streptomyces sp. ET3-23]|uniref:FAD/NAD(P)-binding protein n=1 Tax=Streptomyces sp. ET3-23 TaxID=2885643 RepID=UPI001D10A41F|nr:FAD/NAD(P)-binding protein [Streptomyces sp. ET3-23]MCC2279833.1 FAD/NAD(P)-binding protein [Streptomyces sp. ET3-23]
MPASHTPARSTSPGVPDVTIAIVGLGPRGLSVLERVMENARANPGRTVLVHAIDSHAPGSGNVWRPTQSRHLLMNTVASQVTMYTDPSVSCRGPIVPGPSLYEWVRELPQDTLDERFGPELAEQARSLGPDDYPSRALYGHYLQRVFERAVAGAPAGVTVRQHVSRVTAVTPLAGERYQIDLIDEPEPIVADRTVLALGHLPGALRNKERLMLLFAAEHGLRYIPPANPADVDVHRGIGPGDEVILRGLGLNFFDYLSLLTEGRGGRFERRDGRLVYVPSGNEPRMYASSRRGIPYHARGANQKGVSGRHEPRYLTPEVIARLQHRADSTGGLDFMADVWPLVTREVELVHYTTLLRQRGRAAEAEALAAELAEWPGETELEGVLARYGIGAGDRWSWERIGRPWQGERFEDHAAFTAWLLGHLREDLDNSRGGNLDNPVKAALDAMRDLRNEVRQVIDHGRVAADSYRDHVSGFYTPLNGFVSIGPPASRIEEMIALVEAGVLDVLGPDVEVGAEVLADGSGRFTARSPLVPGSHREATVLIEARLPSAGIAGADDPLVGRLVDEGIARRHALTKADEEHHTGALEVTGTPYRVIDRSGRPHRGLHAFGVPTEGVHWATAAGIRPGVDSVILGDADAIARVLLGLDAAEDGPARPDEDSGSLAAQAA